MAEDQENGTRFANPFESFRYVPFRWFWFGQWFTTLSNWTDNLVRGWLVYELTGSVAQLGLVMAAKSLPLLVVGIIGGALADKVDRRKVLVAAQIGLVAAHAVVAAALFLDQITVWHLYATALASGLARGLQAPARFAMLPATVPKPLMQNAVVLNNSTQTMAQAVGPALGGVSIAALGFGWTFAGLALMNVFSGYATNRIRVPLVERESKGQKVLSSIRDGFAYVAANRTILTLLLLALVPMFLAYPHQQLVPAVAEEVLRIGPEQTGLLLGASGIGSLLAMISISTVRTIPRRGLVLVVTVCLFGGTVALFGVSTSYALSFTLILLAGACRGIYRTINHVLLIANTEDNYLGRVNSIYVLDRGLVPLGTMVVGFVAEGIGTGPALAWSGTACLLLGAGAAVFTKELRAAR